MQLTCVQCNQSLPMGATFCSACGRPVDADRDGVPDALGKMIEQKARAIVAEERAADQAVQAARKTSELLTKLTAEASAAELALEQNAKRPRSFLGAFGRLTTAYTVIVFIVWMLLGPLFHFLFSAFDVSPAGIVLCSTHCDGCEGPGRVFAWSYKGSFHDKKGRMGYALVCHNKKVNIDKLTWADVRSDPLNTELQPYMVHGVWAFFVEGFVLAPTLGLVLGLAFTNRQRRRWGEEKNELEQTLRRIQAQRAALTGDPVAATDTFRA